MSIEHQNICSTMTLKHYKPNDIIVRQGDPGDSFFYILSGTVNIKLNITIDTGIKGEDKIVTIEKSNIIYFIVFTISNSGLLSYRSISGTI